MPESPLSKSSLDEFAMRKLRSLERRRLRRELVVTDSCSAPRVGRDGRELVSFSSNDYLGLSRHPDVVAAGIEAMHRYGAGAGASRLITGNHPLYDALEQRLADLKGSEQAVVFGSGYLTNVGVIPVLAGPPDLILIDALCHSCLGTGAKLSGAHVLEFPHNDEAGAAALLERHRRAHRHCLLVTDGVFSMEGDIAPLPELSRLAEQYDCWLMTDDAHGLGVVGGGRGSSFAFDEALQVPLQMGTLSKAVGGYGGYICASTNVAELLRNRARSFVYSTGLPPGVVAAASAALRIISTDAALVAAPLLRAQLFTDTLGLPRAQSPIVPLVLGTAERALTASRFLQRQGFLVNAIRPPTVPAGTSRLRLAFSALHTEQDVLRLAEAIGAMGAIGNVGAMGAIGNVGDIADIGTLERGT